MAKRRKWKAAEKSRIILEGLKGRPEGALIFCRIRAYLITCRKHGVTATEAPETLFKGRLPDFVYHEK